MNTEIQDLRRVVLRAQRLGGKVVVGGHSLGGSITSAYATWDFGGKPGARGLAGLVFIDGGSSPTADHRRRRAPAPDRPRQRLAVADVRRHPRAVHRAVQHERLARRADSTRLAVARSGQSGLLPGEPRAAGPGDERRPVRLRAGHRDLAAEPRRGAGAPRPPRGVGRPARLGRRRRAHADHALRRRCSPAGG